MKREITRLNLFLKVTCFHLFKYYTHLNYIATQQLILIKYMHIENPIWCFHIMSYILGKCCLDFVSLMLYTYPVSCLCFLVHSWEKISLNSDVINYMSSLVTAYAYNMRYTMLGNIINWPIWSSLVAMLYSIVKKISWVNQNPQWKGQS